MTPRREKIQNISLAVTIGLAGAYWTHATSGYMFAGLTILYLILFILVGCWSGLAYRKTKGLPKDLHAGRIRAIIAAGFLYMFAFTILGLAWTFITGLLQM